MPARRRALFPRGRYLPIMSSATVCVDKGNHKRLPFTAVETIGSHVVTTMNFATGLINSQGCGGQCIVGTTHATLGAGFTVLLYGHGRLTLKFTYV